MEYGYVRVSSVSQNLDRQIADMKQLGLDDKHIYADRQSGKDFDRVNYQRLKSQLKKGDLVIIKSIDRLGRNYDMITQEWKDLVTNRHADIFVIDMPLLDTRATDNNLVGRFISDIVLQLLSFVAENERDNIRKRQAEGIAIAKSKGIHLGRPPIALPLNFGQIARQYNNKEITLAQALLSLDMKKSTFYKYYCDTALQCQDTY